MTSEDIDLPFASVQWQGTDVCMDVHCKCGASGHIDGDFVFRVRCVECGAVYEMARRVGLREQSPEEVAAEAARGLAEPDDFGMDVDAWRASKRASHQEPTTTPVAIERGRVLYQRWKARAKEYKDKGAKKHAAQWGLAARELSEVFRFLPKEEPATVVLDESAPFTEESVRALGDALAGMALDKTVTTLPNGNTSTTIRAFVRPSDFDPSAGMFDAWPETKKLIDAYHRAVEGMLVELGGLGGPVASRGYVEGKPYETLLLDMDNRVLGRVWLDTSEPEKITVRAERVDPPRKVGDR
jgi:hypothetical protein